MLLTTISFCWLSVLISMETRVTCACCLLLFLFYFFGFIKKKQTLRYFCFYFLVLKIGNIEQLFKKFSRHKKVLQNILFLKANQNWEVLKNEQNHTFFKSTTNAVQYELIARQIRNIYCPVHFETKLQHFHRLFVIDVTKIISNEHFWFP